MRVWARVDGERYRGLSLRAHSFLDGVPLHDVWQVRLPGGGPGRTLADAHAVLTDTPPGSVSPAVRVLFGLRRGLGRVFNLDRKPTGPGANSFIERLTVADREQSMVMPGSAQGPFTVMYAFPTEAVSEARNATVHAFLVYVLEPDADTDSGAKGESGYLLTWAIHVKAVSALTPIYMALINPFRRLIVYPSILKQIHRRWVETYGPSGAHRAAST